MNKRGISVIIGYLLLVSFAIIMSAGIYAWMKTYVPTEELDCPDGVSLYIQEATLTNNSETNYTLNLTLKNNGRFSLAGYYIHATDDPLQEVATINLYDKYDSATSGGVIFGSSILFDPGNANTFSINSKTEEIFNLNNPIYSVTIIPTRFNEIEGKTKYGGCSDSKIEEIITSS